MNRLEASPTKFSVCAGAAGARGFALIITLALLAFLMLVVYGLSAMTRLSGRVATVSAYQVQARQNALLALDVALGELSRQTRDPSRLTGMAGVTGLGAGAANRTRHWCGVWSADGSLVAWLVSGAASATTLNGEVIELVASGTVGAAAANSEHVIAGKLPVIAARVPGRPGISTTVGHYAFLVMDEGVKISAYAPDAVEPLQIAPATSAATKLHDTLAAFSDRRSRVLSYEQLALLPAPSSPLSSSVLQDNFHHVTLTARQAGSGAWASGLVNPNTNSAAVWRSLLWSYNQTLAPDARLATATIETRGAALAAALPAYAGPGKGARGPFRSCDAVADFLATVFPQTGTPTAAQVMSVIGRLLVVRSDTFRIRAYGDAVSPFDPDAPGAEACVEAIVQRQPDGRFATVYFRWLGPGDI